MKKLVPAVAATLVIALAPSSASGHTCRSAGTKHAVIAGAHKCLKTGQFCKRSANAAYRRYGFKCVTGSDGRARLRRA